MSITEGDKILEVENEYLDNQTKRGIEDLLPYVGTQIGPVVYRAVDKFLQTFEIPYVGSNRIQDFPVEGKLLNSMIEFELAERISQGEEVTETPEQYLEKLIDATQLTGMYFDDAGFLGLILN